MKVNFGTLCAKRPSPVFGGLLVGDTFTFPTGNCCYMRIDDCRSGSDSVNTVNLNNGCLYYTPSDRVIFPRLDAVVMVNGA